MIIILHDNNSEVLKDIRKETSVEAIHKLATEHGLIASHTFDMRWISLALTPTSEDIFIARQVDTVEFEDDKYPVRTFKVEIDGQEQDIMIGNINLLDNMGDNIDDETNELDGKIYFYVENELIGLDAEDICKNHLDAEIKFIEELFN